MRVLCGYGRPGPGQVRIVGWNQNIFGLLVIELNGFLCFTFEVDSEYEGKYQ
jgi:hypothetical protein